MSVFLYQHVLEKTFRLSISSRIGNFYVIGPTKKEDFKMDRGFLHLSALNSCKSETKLVDSTSRIYFEKLEILVIIKNGANKMILKKQNDK